MTKKTTISFLITLSTLFALSFAAQAATSKVIYDASGGTLSVSGTCSARFVLVIVRKASDNSIWGSSNPACVNGSYQYDADVPDADRGGSTFTVQVFDQASAGGGIPASSAGVAAAQAVVFSPPPAAPASAPVADSIALTIDTSSLATVAPDQSFLDSMLSQFFGIVTDAAAAIQNFSVIVADSIKSSLIATVNLFSKTITILPSGSINVPRGQNQLSGQASLAAGASEVFITNTAVTSSSQIVITPTSPSQLPLAVGNVVAGDGFSVGTISPQQIAVSFTWLIVGTYTAGPPTSAGSQQGSQQAAQSQTVSLPPPPIVAPMGVTTTSDVIITASTTTTTTTPDATGTPQ